MIAASCVEKFIPFLPPSLLLLGNLHNNTKAPPSQAVQYRAFLVFITNIFYLMTTAVHCVLCRAVEL